MGVDDIDRPAKQVDRAGEAHGRDREYGLVRVDLTGFLGALPEPKPKQDTRCGGYADAAEDQRHPEELADEVPKPG